MALVFLLALVVIPGFAAAQSHPEGGRLPVTPVLGCMYPIPENPTMFNVLFGYDNPNSEEVEIPFGALNFFSPTPIDRGQPTVFMPGLHAFAFEVFFPSDLFSRLEWHLDGSTIEIRADTASLASCQRLLDPRLPEGLVFFDGFDTNGVGFWSDARP